jgi:hypothetical protein
MSKPERPTTLEEEGIELHPDALERFEKTFDKVVKAPPAHQTGKTTVANRSRKRGVRAPAKPSG